MKIAAVIVTYNRKKLLEEVIEAFDNQTRLPDYVIIVDNASTDGTNEFLSSWSNIEIGNNKIVISSKKNLGGSGGFYLGTKRALKTDADWIWVSDDDAVPNLDVFEKAEMLVRNKRIKKTNDGRPYIVFLDEIELALHAAALRRMVLFLKEISEELGLSIFFSTHSLELIRDIKPQNIFYLTRLPGDKIIITNPCYPAFATRNLYSDDGYGNDLVILVEDDLAKKIMEYVLIKEELLSNIRIKVLPTGGWTNTIIMARDVVASKLLVKGTRIITVLDKDIESEVPKFLSNHKNCKGVQIDYLPISSLEKYLKSKLIDDFEEDFYQKMNSYLFQGKSLESTLREYEKLVVKKGEEDTDGKSLYGLLIDNLKSIRKDRDDLVDAVMDYVRDHEQDQVKQLKEFLAQSIR